MSKRAVVLSFELWQHWMTQGYETHSFRCEKGLPDDARLIASFFVAHIGPAGIFESESFAPLEEPVFNVMTPQGEDVPMLNVTFRSC